MDDSTLLYEQLNESKELESEKQEEEYSEEDSFQYVSNEIFEESESVEGEKLQGFIHRVEKNMPAKYSRDKDRIKFNKVIQDNYIAERISSRFNTLLQNIISWEGHGTHKKTSEPLIAAAKKMAKLRQDYKDYEPGEAQALLGDLMAKAVYYLNKNSGYRFFKSGDRRKDTVRALISEASDYAFKAGAGYVEEYGNVLVFGDIGK